MPRVKVMPALGVEIRITDSLKRCAKVRTVVDL
jgi:hypothetical protein